MTVVLQRAPGPSEGFVRAPPMPDRVQSCMHPLHVYASTNARALSPFGERACRRGPNADHENRSNYSQHEMSLTKFPADSGCTGQLDNRIGHLPAYMYVARHSMQRKAFLSNQAMSGERIL